MSAAWSCSDATAVSTGCSGRREGCRSRGVLCSAQQSRCRCGSGEPPATQQMWAGCTQSLCRCGSGEPQSRCRCGWGELKAEAAEVSPFSRAHTSKADVQCSVRSAPRAPPGPSRRRRCCPNETAPTQCSVTAALAVQSDGVAECAERAPQRPAVCTVIRPAVLRRGVYTPSVSGSCVLPFGH